MDLEQWKKAWKPYADLIDGWNEKNNSADWRNDLRRELGYTRGNGCSLGMEVGLKAIDVAGLVSRQDEPEKDDDPLTPLFLPKLEREDRLARHDEGLDDLCQIMHDTRWNYRHPTGDMKFPPENVEDILRTKGMAPVKWSDLPETMTRTLPVIFRAYHETVKKQRQIWREMRAAGCTVEEIAEAVSKYLRPKEEEEEEDKDAPWTKRKK